MSLKSNYPVIINGVQYEPFKTWAVMYNDSVVIHETEGGTQEDSISRKGRRSITVGTTCLESVARQLIALQKLPYFNVQFYDLEEGGYVTIRMRVGISSFKASLRDKSSKVNYCNGVWIISFNLEEF